MEPYDEDVEWLGNLIKRLGKERAQSILDRARLRRRLRDTKERVIAEMAREASLGGSGRKVYQGFRHANGRVDSVTVNGSPLYNYDSCNSEGFEWGYVGAGPRALAISILCDYFEYPEKVSGDHDPAHPVHGEIWAAFIKEVVKEFPHSGGFRLTSEQISEWIAAQPPISEGG